MIAYAETSAVLTWLLGETHEAEVRRILGGAGRVVSSSLTGVECARVLARGVATRQLGEADELAALRLLDSAVAGWAVIEMTGRVLARARGRFPKQPLRMLDALHLATAAIFSDELGPLTVVSLDHRVRDNALGLGFDTVP